MMSQQTKVILVCLFLVATVTIWVRGCRQYGEVNAVTFEHAKALYSVCNRHDSERLEICATMIESAAADQQISTTEAGYLRNIILAARGESWDDAQLMARQLMTDQADR